MADNNNRYPGYKADDDHPSFDKKAYEAAYERSKNQFTMEFEKTLLTDFDLKYGLEDDEEKQSFFGKIKKSVKKKDQKQDRLKWKDESSENKDELINRMESSTRLSHEMKNNDAEKREEEQPEPVCVEPVEPNEIKSVKENCFSAEPMNAHDNKALKTNIKHHDCSDETLAHEDTELLGQAIYGSQEKCSDFVLKMPHDENEFDFISNLQVDAEQQEVKIPGVLATQTEQTNKGKAKIPPVEESKANIKNEISKSLFSLKMKKIFTSMIALLLIYLDLSQNAENIIIAQLRYSQHPQTFTAANLVLLLLLIPVAIDVMAYGFMDMMNFKFSTLTMQFLLYTVTFVHTILIFFLHYDGGKTSLQVLAFLPAIYVWLYYKMELKHILKIKGDFKRLISTKETMTGCITKDALISDHCEAKRKEVCIFDCVPDNNAELLSNFMDKSYENTRIYDVSRVVYPVLIILPLIVSVFYAVTNKDVAGMFSALTLYYGTAVLFCPELLVNLPYIWGTQNDHRKKAALIGYDSVGVFAEADELIVSDKQIFPLKSVTLSGIKLFGDARIDKIIVETASVLCAVDGPGTEVLMNVIGHRKELLVDVSDIRFQVGCGLSACVGKEQILIGTRDFMRENRIVVPEGDIASKLKETGRQGLFIAKDGILCALVVLVYTLHSDIELMLQKLCDDGVHIHIKTFDPLISPTFINDILGFHSKDISVLSPSVADQLSERNYEMNEDADVLISYGNSILPQCKALLDCVRIKQTVKSNLVVAFISVLVSLAIITLLLFGGSLSEITAFGALIYGVLWSIPILLLSISLKF